MSDGLEITLLGGLRVTRHGVELDLGRPKQRLVFVLLALEADRVVPAERLLELLWGAEGDKERGALQSYVSNLRRVLEPGPAGTPASVLVRRAPGYVLVVDRDRVDGHRFERLVDEGRRARAAGDEPATLAAMEAALALWAGPPLPELAGEAPVVDATRRWGGLRLVAAEAAAEVHLRAGAADAAVALLEPLLGVDAHERLHTSAALALYRVGRQADALRVLDGVRTQLREGAGLEPTEDLRRLERQILEHDPALRGVAPTRPAARSLVPTVPARSPDAVLFGRDAELDALGAALLRAAAGAGGVVTVIGPPGAGKTALVEGALDALEGTAVVWARCPESAAAPPYWPLTHLAEQLQETGVVAAPSVDDPALGGDAFVIAQRWARALRAASRPVALVVDDLQWADRDTLRVLTHLAAELRTTSVALVVTARPLDPEEGTDLVSCRAELARAGVVDVVVSDLDVSAVEAWVTASTGRADPDLAAAVHERAGGNALFVRELLLLAQGGPDVASGSSGGRLGTVPPGVQAVVRRRVGLLPAPTQRLLSLASVMGTELDVVVLADVSGASTEQVLTDLAPALAARLLTEEPEAGRLRFSHAIVTEALFAELPPARRASGHAAVARALLVHRPGEDGAALVAHHALAGSLAGTADLAATAAARAAQLATERSAHADAAHLWGLATEALARSRPSDQPARAAHLVALAQAHERADQMPEAKRAVAEALRLGRALDDAATVAAAAAVVNHASIFPNQGYGEVDHEMVTLLERLLAGAEPGDRPERVLLQAALATELVHTDEQARRDELTRDALEAARRLEDPLLLVRALHARTFALKEPLASSARRAVAQELAEVAERHRLGDDWALLGHLQVALTDFGLGAIPAASGALPSLRARAERPVGQALRSQLALLGAHLALVQGRGEEALRQGDEAHDLFRRSRPDQAGPIRLAQQLTFAHDLGGVEPVLAAFPPEVRGPGYTTAIQLYAAVMLFDLGRPADARARIPMPPGALLDRPLDYLTVFLDVAAATVAAETADEVAAAGLLTRLAPLAGRWANAGTGAGSLGFVDLALARLQVVAGDHAAARQGFEQAVVVHERAGTPPWLARTLVHQGRFLRSVGDGAAGDAALARAAQLAELHRLPIVAAQVAATA